MDINILGNTLTAIYNNLNRVTVQGKDNCKLLLGSMNGLEKILEELNNELKNSETKD